MRIYISQDSDPVIIPLYIEAGLTKMEIKIKPLGQIEIKRCTEQKESRVSREKYLKSGRAQREDPAKRLKSQGEATKVDADDSGNPRLSLDQKKLEFRQIVCKQAQTYSNNNGGWGCLESINDTLPVNAQIRFRMSMGLDSRQRPRWAVWLESGNDAGWEAVVDSQHNTVGASTPNIILGGDLYKGKP